MAAHGMVLALGGGGARGLAHLGVLHVLTEHQLPLAGIVGTSMGAVVASMYGAGLDLDRLEQLAEVYPWRDLLDLNIPRFGLVGGERIQAALEILTKGKTFAQLDLPVWVVATDLDAGVPVVLKEGPLAPAVRASASVPGFFAPHKIDGRVLIDGGVLAGVPVEIAQTMGSPVVAVDVGFDFRQRQVHHFFDILAKVVAIMGNELDRRQVESADAIIRPAVNHVGSTRFDLAGECIAAGRRAAEDALPALRALVGMEGLA